jgi:hypothetical protein
MRHPLEFRAFPAMAEFTEFRPMRGRFLQPLRRMGVFAPVVIFFLYPLTTTLFLLAKTPKRPRMAGI